MRLLSKTLALMSHSETDRGFKELPAIPAHWCEGCKQMHPITVNQQHPTVNWEWNGDAQKPTFKPSVKITNGLGFKDICHYVITNGEIYYCDDTTHILSGQTIPLPDIPQDVIDFWKIKKE